MQEEHSAPLPAPGEQGQSRAVWNSGVPGRGEGAGSCLANLPLWPSQFSTTQTSSMAMFAKLQTFLPDIRRKGTLGGGEGVLVFKA